MKKSIALMSLLFLCNFLTTTRLSAQGQINDQKQRDAILWARLSLRTPEPPNYHPADVEPAPRGGTAGSPWTNSQNGTETKLPNSGCLVDDKIKAESQKLLDSVKYLYSQRGWTEQFKEILQKEPKDCALNIVIYRISIAGQALKELAAK